MAKHPSGALRGAGIVKLLLEREDINPNTADIEYGQTKPLSWAAEGGHEEAVKFPLEREDINPSIADIGPGQTPLSWAARGGYERVVKLLLERKDINPNTIEALYGRTPLLWAAGGGHEGVAKLLSEREDIGTDIRSLSGGTALELTSLWGTGIVELLSRPKPRPPVPSDIPQAPKRPSTKSSNLLRNPHLPIPPTCPPQHKSLHHETQPLFGMAVPSFVVISSLIFLFYFLTLIKPSPAPTSLLPFYR